MKWIASPGLMHDTGCLGLVHWDDPEGWYGEGDGRRFRMGNTCTPMADSCWCMTKPIQYCKVKKKRILYLPKSQKLLLENLTFLFFFSKSNQHTKCQQRQKMVLWQTLKIFFFNWSTWSHSNLQHSSETRHTV